MTVRAAGKGSGIVTEAVAPAEEGRTATDVVLSIGSTMICSVCSVTPSTCTFGAPRGHRCTQFMYRTAGSNRPLAGDKVRRREVIQAPERSLAAVEIVVDANHPSAECFSHRRRRVLNPLSLTGLAPPVT
jgi:hypothetical protein